MKNSRAHSVNEVMKAVESLPSIPQAIAEIMRTIDDDSATAKMLADKIEGDVGLLVSVLKLVNSPRYSMHGGISSSQQAVQVLGFNVIRSFACMEGISAYFRKNSNNEFNFEKFMRHGVGVACCAKYIARRAKLNPEVAFVAGLLHDMGQLALAVTMPNAYRLVEEYQRTHDCHLSVAERAIMGTDHAQVGAHLANRWNFPTEIVMSIKCHHKMLDAEAGSHLADLIHVSEVLSHGLDLGMTSQVPPLSDEALLRLGITLPQMAPFFEGIEEEYNDLAQLLGV